MSKTYALKPQNVCSQLMEITMSDDGKTIENLVVQRGCDGNLQGIARLVKGRSKEEIIALLSGIKCRGSRTKETSCPDQLAKLLETI